MTVRIEITHSIFQSIVFENFTHSIYAGCDCNYDLCKSQRNGDYHKWKWFDYCLWNAIRKLSRKEKGKYPVYSGLNGVKMDKRCVTSGYFVTYVSTSWKKEVSKAFMKGKGMLIHFDEDFRNDLNVDCCDVSWVSNFPDECEVLFSRSLHCKYANNFQCVVLDQVKGMQTISLTKSKN